ncbi:hypothetical protein PSTT_03457 [Puccinia striiformis]|uniref:Uncharacterized protein n=1 Tax=Puccinia striiformis TaxID=27350 RepID=A0A2S4VWG7_9BASI|nr:hypothetical protein PSTT_03457 [Puccinia striiformis]
MPMIGRCGRGEDNPGLGIMFAETNLRTGKNKISDFPSHQVGLTGYCQPEDDHMDALAITPLGYVLLSNADSNVETEKIQEAQEGFAECLCLNCEQNVMSKELNFEVPFSPPLPSCITKKTGKQSLRNELKTFAAHMVQQLEAFHKSQIPDYPEFNPKNHFGMFKARRMVLAFDEGFSVEHLDRLMGGDAIDGQFKFLKAKLDEYSKTDAWKDYLNALHIEEEELIDNRKNASAARKQEARARRTEGNAETKRQKIAAQADSHHPKTDGSRGRGCGKGIGCGRGRARGSWSS